MIRLSRQFSGPPYVGTCALAPEVVRAELGVELQTRGPDFRYVADPASEIVQASEPVEQPVDHRAEWHWLSVGPNRWRAEG